MSWTPHEALTRLLRAGKENRLAHAYLIAGPPEQTQTELLEPWLKQLLQTNPFPHPDVHVISPESKTRQIRVESIRQLITDLNRTSFLEGWKIGIIFEADRLGSEAANAFLKTLEEPSKTTLLLLLTERPEQLLPTLLSRCVILRLKTSPAPLPPSLQALLEDIAGAIPIKDLSQAYHFLNQALAYLRETRKNLEEKTQEELKQAKQNNLEADALNEIEKTFMAKMDRDYLTTRRKMLEHLAQALPSIKPDIFNEADKALARNLPEIFVLENLFIRLRSTDQTSKR